ncbi:hypothetical protein PoB_004266300 [Plakobranchus ocellatus]|uniref:Uncharacterized protein n=1 Tax=Plakobranchus ocellatus TaxID=259542 RepID=A0AAV4BAI2_9GAST|nr:hypothetical protein PoB_004266300 [Plakobranchus ocellatus]
MDGTVDGESALTSAEKLLSRIRILPLVPWPERGPESLRSPCLSTIGDLRLSGPPSGQGAAGGGARIRNRRVPADIRVDSLSTLLPPTHTPL